MGSGDRSARQAGAWRPEETVKRDRVPYSTPSPEPTDSEETWRPIHSRSPRLALPRSGNSGSEARSDGISFEELVSALREIGGLKDVGNEQPKFHFRSRPFLHFHESERGPYADVRFGTGDFEPVWVATPSERADLLERVRRHVRALERSRKWNRFPRSGR